MDRTLTQISADLDALTQLMLEAGGDVTDEELDEAVTGWFDSLGAERDEKLDATLFRIAELETRAEYRKERAKHYSTRKRADESAAKRLRRRMAWFFVHHALSTVETRDNRFTVVTPKPKEVLVVDDPRSVPAECQEVTVSFTFCAGTLPSGLASQISELLERCDADEAVSTDTTVRVLEDRVQDLIAERGQVPGAHIEQQERDPYMRFS